MKEYFVHRGIARNSEGNITSSVPLGKIQALDEDHAKNYYIKVMGIGTADILLTEIVKCLHCGEVVPIGELICGACKMKALDEAKEFVHSHPVINDKCQLCGAPVAQGFSECESCRNIPASHPFRQRLSSKQEWDAEFKELKDISAEDRNKYRRK